MLEAGLLTVGIDSAQSFIEPGANLAKHHVVVRDVACGIQLPVFQQCGGTVHHPPSPRGISVLHGHLVGGFCIAVLAKGIEQRLAAEHAHIQMVTRCDDLLIEVVSHLCLEFVGHYTPIERHAQFGLCTAGIDSLLRIQVFVVDGLADVSSQTAVFLVVLCVSEHFCCTGQNLCVHIIIYAGSQFLVGTHRNGHPVATSPGGKMTAADAAHIIHISLDVRIAAAERLVVAIEQIKVPGDDGNGAGPVQTIVCAVAPATSGDNVGQHTVGLLFVAMVGHPFLIHGDAVKVVQCRFYCQMAIARPSVLLALWAVRGIAHQVGEVGLVGCRHKSFNQFLRRLDFTHLGHIAVYKICHHALLANLNGSRGLHLHISEPLVVETCHKLVLASAQGQYVCLEGVGLLVAPVIYIYVRLVQTAVLAKSFSVANLYYCAFRSLQAEAGNTSHIIPKII